MYGEKNTFEDAKTTVTGFLDDFYDDSPGNYNQAFSNLERRLQEYFEYERRGPESLDEEPVQKPAEYVVYNDGQEWARCRTEKDAQDIVRLYTGDHHVWYEAIQEGA